MIYVEETYDIECDRCGERFSCSDNRIFSSEARVKDAALNYGWAVDGPLCYCQKCLQDMDNYKDRTKENEMSKM